MIYDDGELRRFVCDWLYLYVRLKIKHREVYVLDGRMKKRLQFTLLFLYTKLRSALRYIIAPRAAQLHAQS